MAKRRDDWRDLDWSVFARGDGEAFRGTSGNDRLVGTDQADTFHIQQGGRDRVNAGQGRDIIHAGTSLTTDDHINGGAGYDKLVIEGDYSNGLTLKFDTISRIERIDLKGEFDYVITLGSDIRHDKINLVIDAAEAQSLYVDGSEMDFLLLINGSSGDDVIIGEAGIDVFTPNGGYDVLTGGAGGDNFYFNFTSDSLSSNPDVITDFDGDIIILAAIDGNTTKAGDQDLHFGATPGRTGDVTVSYDAGQDVTFVNVFTDSDANPDMVIQLLGDHSDLTSADFLL